MQINEYSSEKKSKWIRESDSGIVYSRKNDLFSIDATSSIFKVYSGICECNQSRRTIMDSYDYGYITIINIMVVMVVTILTITIETIL